MKYSLLLTATLAFGQPVTTSISTDLNGHRVEGPTTVATDGQKTQIYQSINGRKVPLEQTEERILRDGPSGKTVEKITRKFDPNGGLASTERTVVEEENLSDGKRERSITYRSDLNGGMHEAERKTVESHTQGSNANSDSEVQRPDLNGSFQAVEKSASHSTTSNNVTSTDKMIYRRSENGGFYPAVRDVSESALKGSETVVTSAHYEPIDSQQLKLIGQTVSTTVKRADGSTVAEVSLYGAATQDGRVRDSQSGLHLREQQTIEKIVGSGGNVTEIVTARRPTAADPSKLGPAVRVSETVCTGKCK